MVTRHLPLHHALDSDPEVMRYILGRARTPQEIDQFWGHRCAKAANGFWVGVLPDGSAVGWWHLLSRPGRTAELGYRIRRTNWRTGLATEGSRALVRHGFQTLGLHAISAETMAVNAGSRAVMQRLGMTHEETTHRVWDHPIPGTDQGEVIYRITADRWRRDQDGPATVAAERRR